MDIYKSFRDIVVAEIGTLQEQGVLPAKIDLAQIAVDPAREPAHGDIATNAALVLAKAAGCKPRGLAEKIVEGLVGRENVISAEVAGPGFVNLRLGDGLWREELRDILRSGPAYGDSALGCGRRINVEYVSVNPTGPLHVGHARGTVVGDALASLLEKAGYQVEREYYINDAGAQVDTLGRSAYLRYREALGEAVGEIPSGLYPGEYLKPVGAGLTARDGRKWLGVGEDVWLPPVRDFAVDAMMSLIKRDLAALGVTHDRFSSERAVVDAGGMDEVCRTLEDKGLLYTGVLEPPKGKVPDDWEPRPQLLFRATEFGDDVDRPLKKSDGSWTYFATDLAYHLDKCRRGFFSLIDVWGADHGGYVKRLKAGVIALSDGETELDVKICQMVKLMEGGQPAKMSKRAGTFVTLGDLVDAVGRDVVRFIMLTRRNDAPLEFDLIKVTEQSRDNPVFYVQYAHARCRSVLRHAANVFPTERLEPAVLAGVDLIGLTDSEELGLIKKMAAWPRTVEGAALAHEPHRVAFYLNELAAAFHALWTKGKDNADLRFLRTDMPELSLARLALVQAVAIVIASGLSVMGVEPVEEMRA